MKKIVGKKVYIKADMSEWGIVIAKEGEDIYVAMFDNIKEQRVFERNKILIPKG